MLSFFFIHEIINCFFRDNSKQVFLGTTTTTASSCLFVGAIVRRNKNIKNLKKLKLRLLFTIII